MLLTDVKLMMVKVRMISVAQVKAVRMRRRRRLLTPRKNEAVKAFQRESSPVADGLARFWSWFISDSKRRKMIMVTMKDRPMIKNARITTRGLYAS